MFRSQFFSVSKYCIYIYICRALSEQNIVITIHVCFDRLNGILTETRILKRFWRVSHQNSAVRTGQTADLKIHDGRGKCYVCLRFNFFSLLLVSFVLLAFGLFGSVRFPFLPSLFLVLLLLSSRTHHTN